MCGEEESCSDHKLILFDIEGGTSCCNVFNHAQKRYQIKTDDWGKFENKLVSNLLLRFNCANNSSDLIKCDEQLGEKVKQSTDTGERMSKLTSIITATCDAAFKVTSWGSRYQRKKSTLVDK